MHHKAFGGLDPPELAWELTAGFRQAQWRSKALRGPGSTVTWGPIPSLPSLPLYPFPSLSPYSSPHLGLEVGPFNPATGSGEHCKLPRGSAPAEIEFGAF